MRLSAVVDFKMKAFAAAVPTDYSTGMFNCIGVEKEGKKVATQRPSVSVVYNASADSLSARGRAAYKWASNGIYYFVNNGAVRRKGVGSTSTLVGNITAGTKKCKFIPVGTLLVLVDFENDEAWTITSGHVITKITDADFPTTLAYGAEELNGTLYLLDDIGIIYGSDTDDPTSWNALNFLNAERSLDGGAFLGKHHDNIVVIGPKSTEFFNDAGNSTGSLLNRREDIAYQFGAKDGEGCWINADRLFMVGANSTGSLTVYMLDNFAFRRISNDELDTYLTENIDNTGYSMVGSGLGGMGHLFYTVTVYSTPTDVTPFITIVYDLMSGLWHFWITTVGSLSAFPVVDFSVGDATGDNPGIGMMTNGDMFVISDTLIPEDTVDDGSADPSASISCSIRFGQNDFGTNNVKHCEKLRFVGDLLESAALMAVIYSNDNNKNFTSARAIDISTNAALKQLGRFRRRNFEVQFSPTEIVYIEGIEIDVSVGDS